MKRPRNTRRANSFLSGKNLSQQYLFQSSKLCKIACGTLTIIKCVWELCKSLGENFGGAQWPGDYVWARIGTLCFPVSEHFSNNLWSTLAESVCSLPLNKLLIEWMFVGTEPRWLMEMVVTSTWILIMSAVMLMMNNCQMGHHISDSIWQQRHLFCCRHCMVSCGLFSCITIGHPSSFLFCIVQINSGSQTVL
jgi:hypothetical protein